MRHRSIASLVRASGLLAAVLLALFAVYGPTVVAHQDAPGNNGTVKIHDGAGEPSPSEVRNQPHVCTFHLHFYFADPEQAGSWEIQEWAPTGQKGTVVLSGTYDTAGDGEDRQPETGAYSLPDGHYKLFWDGDTGKHDKMKVFWVECGTTQQTPSPTGSELPEQGSPSPTGSELPEQGSPSPTGSELPEQGSPSPTGSELPEQGSPSPTGSELPAEGTPPAATSTPGGEVLGAVGTPGVTPPPTDTVAVQPTPSNDGWRLVALALAAVIAFATFLIRAPRTAEVRVRRTPEDR
jgi:hypothetical protein